MSGEEFSMCEKLVEAIYELCVERKKLKKPKMDPDLTIDVELEEVSEEDE